jgi:hypothetical protein
MRLAAKKGPAGVEENICGQLLSVRVEAHRGSVNSDDVSDSLADGQVVELVREQAEGNILDLAVLRDRAALVCNFHRADIPVSFLRSMWEGGVQDHRVEMHLVVTNFALFQGLVCVVS